MTTATGSKPPTGNPLPGDGALVTLLRAPWTPQAWLSTANVVTGFLIALIAWTVIYSLTFTVALLAVTLVFAVPFLALTFSFARLFTSWQRGRLEAFTGAELEPIHRTTVEGGWLGRLWADTRSSGTWRQVGYHLLSGITSSIAFAVVAGFWVGGVLLATIALYAWSLPEKSILADYTGNPAALAALTVLGLIMFFAAPWVAGLASQLDTALGTALLAPSRSEELARKVVTLSASRAEVIDAADSERRRIERDLHDGTQQRLVSLAMNLGLARTTMTDVPDHAKQAIEQAHEEAKTALQELRDVVRGLHPAVLDDLGLDAALSGIAARSPVPVRLLAELPHRPPRTVETVAYFVVSEALANVAKHAEASRVDVVVEETSDGTLRIIVSDDGRGGADPANGTGLRGLKQRVGSVDGTMTIDSPAGGPTLLVVELPCAL
ncbi:sensor histidine kinase [Longispora albida]|uniref:sensor histidine kinase n=1 Tax=Longispora albida TaxID=203523 RepID=UPI0003A1511A|nr:sensor histidine kinase [Longispora albida]